MELYKIVITGGPCAGKTTAMSWIQNAFSAKGYTVLFIPETATELISGGVCPWTCGTNLDYQKGQVKLQKTKEDIFEVCARTMPKDKILLVCDRGQLDNKVYMTKEDAKIAFASIGKTEMELRDSYDAVFHLVTAANGAEKFYTTDNNQARTETPEQARVLDDKLIRAWTGHAHYRIIDNSFDFKGKMEKLIYEISSFLGEDKPYVTEKKFLIKYPTLDVLDKLPHVTKIDIVQDYLVPDGDIQYRVRKRGENDNYTYYIKKKNEVRGVELEKRLTFEEYQDYLLAKDPSRNTIYKTRYCIPFNNQYFEIDMFSFWADQAILEIKLSSIDDDINFPEGIEVIKEITGNPEYRNSYLSKNYK